MKSSVDRLDIRVCPSTSMSSFSNQGMKQAPGGTANIKCSREKIDFDKNSKAHSPAGAVCHPASLESSYGTTGRTVSVLWYGTTMVHTY